MERKFDFYDHYGVEEYYLFDPTAVQLSGWRRVEGRLQPIQAMHGWVSPRLQIRFDLSGADLVIYRPDGERFLTFVDLMQQKQEAERRATEERLARTEAEHRTERER